MSNQKRIGLEGTIKVRRLLENYRNETALIICSWCCRAWRRDPEVWRELHPGLLRGIRLNDIKKLRCRFAPGCAPHRACRERIPRTVRYHAHPVAEIPAACEWH